MTRTRLTGHIDVPEPDRESVAAALPEHIRLTRAEPGCLLFHVTPDAQVAGRWQVHELFESRAAFEAHQARVAASAWGKAAGNARRHYRVDEVEA